MRVREKITIVPNNFFIYSLIIAALSLGVIFYLRSAILFLFYPYDLRFDSYPVHNVYRFIEGQPLYKYGFVLPYYCNLCAPLYFIISAFLAKIVNLKYFSALLILCRMVTISAILLSSVIIFGICRRLKYSKATGIIACLLFFRQPSYFYMGFCGSGRYGGNSFIAQ